MPEGADYAGKSIVDLGWGKQYSVYVVKIKRGEKRMVMPPARTVIQEGDKMHITGKTPLLKSFHKMLGADGQSNLRTLRDFFSEDYDRENALACACIKMRGTEPYVGRTIKKSGIYAHGNCMILGIERDGYAINMPDANLIIEKGDILWIIGADTNVRNIAAHSIGEEGSHSEEQETEKGNGDRK